jgi:ribonuclease P protein component
VVKRVARLKRGAEIQRLLETPIKQRSAHFAIHHIGHEGLAALRTMNTSSAPNLSTDHAQTCPKPVDDEVIELVLGCLVPKRHARRAVTRSLLKRQMRSAAERLAEALPNGHALLRLRQPFAPKQYPSACSEALRLAARAELDQLLQRFVAGQPARA